MESGDVNLFLQSVKRVDRRRCKVLTDLCRVSSSTTTRDARIKTGETKAQLGTVTATVIAQPIIFDSWCNHKIESEWKRRDNL